jgi:hypothetical protein
MKFNQITKTLLAAAMSGVAMAAANNVLVI